MPRPKLTQDQVIDSFWGRVFKQEDGCWIWTGKLNEKGYGIVYTAERENVRAHRFAFDLTGKVIPDGMLLRHTCDVRACVNPDHLIVGMPLDNSRDMVTRKRSSKGERHWNARLPDSVVQELRRSGSAGTPLASLASQYGINYMTALRWMRGTSRCA